MDPSVLINNATSPAISSMLLPLMLSSLASRQGPVVPGLGQNRTFNFPDINQMGALFPSGSFAAASQAAVNPNMINIPVLFLGYLQRPRPPGPAQNPVPGPEPVPNAAPAGPEPAPNPAPVATGTTTTTTAPTTTTEVPDEGVPASQPLFPVNPPAPTQVDSGVFLPPIVPNLVPPVIAPIPINLLVQTTTAVAPSVAPTQAPTQAPNQAPTVAPTVAPTQVPTEPPTEAPTESPTEPPTQAPSEAPTQPSTAESSSTSNPAPPNRFLFPNCGRSVTQLARTNRHNQVRIVGGQNTPIDGMPWQVSLQRPKNYAMSHYCGGSIVHPQWILTAAHCLDWCMSTSGKLKPSIRNMRIVAGSDNVRLIPATNYGQGNVGYGTGNRPSGYGTGYGAGSRPVVYGPQQQQYVQQGGGRPAGYGSGYYGGSGGSGSGGYGSSLYGSARRVRRGLGVSNGAVYSSPALVRKVTQALVYPAYVKAKSNNDIALVKLDRPLPLYPFSKANAVCLPAQDEVVPGPMATISGWGQTKEKGRQSFFLKSVNVSVLDDSACSRPYGSSNYNSTQMMCAGDAGKDSCQGDSGGPLFSEDASIRRTVQYGITSFGFGCARPGFPGIYTRVPSYVDWIVQIIRDN